MKLLIFLVFSVALTVSWAQRPTLYGNPSTDQEPTNERASPFKESKFNPRGHGHHGRDSNGPPDSNQPPRLGDDPGFGAPRGDASIGVPRPGALDEAPAFGPPRPPGPMPKANAF